MSACVNYYNDIFTRLGSHTVTPNILNQLKQRYSKDIRSIRREDAIANLGELLRILKKRDCISEHNYEILENIAGFLNVTLPPPPVFPQQNAEINRNIAGFVNITPPPPAAFPQQNVLRPGINSIPIWHSTSQPTVPWSAKDRVYDLISQHVGIKWKELGRRLGIREGQLDDLETRHRFIKDRIMEILINSEIMCDPKHWRTKLLDALVKARRKDLRSKAEYIFDNFP